MKRRRAWFEGELDLDPERLVFIDETWASTNMARTHGRCRRGERLRVGIPHGHWKTTTFVAGLTTRGMIAPFVLDGPINRLAFETYAERVLVAELRQGDVVVMDDLSSHKGQKVRERIEAVGASLLYLPPDSPTSIRSRTPLPSSKPCCAKPPSERSTVSGPPSAASSISSFQTNVETTSPPQDTMQRDRLSL